MDFATLLGLVIGVSIILAAMLSAADISLFVNVPGMMIVFGGTFAATLIKFPLKICFYSIITAVKSAFRERSENPVELILLANKLASLARKKSLLALEDEQIQNRFFRKGIQLCVDGHPPEFIREVLLQKMSLSIERHELGEKVFRAIGDSAPAFGMIGTLVGLVQMLSNLGDPGQVGPGMAVALLTTLYGALFANLVANPIADKMQMRGMQERVNKSLILTSVLSIQKGENPMVMNELLENYLPNHMRHRVIPKDGDKVEEGA